MESSERKSLKDNIYIQLFIEFFTLGLFTFGGGAAMVAVLQDRLKGKNWLTDDEVLDCIAVAQMLPGVIAVNMSVYVGYRMKGIKGALVSVFGMVLPSFIIILVIAMFMENFAENPYVNGALKGIRAATMGLILATALNLAKQTLSKVKGSKADMTFTVLVLLISFLLISVWGIDALYVIIGGMILGIAYSLIKVRRVKQ